MKSKIKYYVVLAVLSCSAIYASADFKPFVKGSFSQIKERIAQENSIVIFWSESCGACLKEMPLWQNLSIESPEINLVFISTDDIENSNDLDVILKEYNLEKEESWAFADSFVERLYFDVDRGWQGELPLIFMFSETGEENKMLGLVDKENVNKFFKITQ